MPQLNPLDVDQHNAEQRQAAQRVDQDVAFTNCNRHCGSARNQADDQRSECHGRYQ